MPAPRLITHLLTLRLRAVVALGLALTLSALPTAALAIACSGFVSPTAAALLFMAGVQLAAFGIIADYLAFTLPQSRRALEQ